MADQFEPQKHDRAESPTFALTAADVVYRRERQFPLLTAANTTRHGKLNTGSLTAFRALNNKRGIAESIEGLPFAAGVQSEPNQAAGLFRGAVSLRDSLGAPLDEATWSQACEQGCSVAGTRRERDSRYERDSYMQLQPRTDAPDAEPLTASVSIASVMKRKSCACEGLGDRQSIAFASITLGTIAHNRGDSERAQALLKESLIVFSELGDRREIAECLELLAGLASAHRQPDRAARLFGSAPTTSHRCPSSTPWPALTSLARGRWTNRACFASLRLTQFTQAKDGSNESHGESLEAVVQAESAHQARRA